MQGVVRKRITKNNDANVVVVNLNKLLDRRKYEVQYLYGFVEKMTANQTAERMLSQM